MLGNIQKNTQLYLLFIALLLSMSSCSYIDPRLVTSEMPYEPPAAKTTQFHQALRDLGKMTKIYDTYTIGVQSIVIGDETGISKAEVTEGEIPQRISEMTNSALNGIGGKVRFIPFFPNYINSMQTVGYPSSNRKSIPNVVLTGGITEFDRGLETRGTNVDAGFGTEPISSSPTWFDSETIDIEYSKADKFSVATITLDSNLIDYQTLTGIAGVQAVNTIRVFKTNSEKELSFSLFGPSFGLRGSIQKVQGRHAAVRLLVQLNTIEVIGRLYNLPYWRLLANFTADNEVLVEIKSEFKRWNHITRIIKIQEMLYLHGYDVPVTGEIDARTRSAMLQFCPALEFGDRGPDAELYLELYTTIPISDESALRRTEFDNKLKNLLQSLQKKENPANTEKS